MFAESFSKLKKKTTQLFKDSLDGKKDDGFIDEFVSAGTARVPDGLEVRNALGSTRGAFNGEPVAVWYAIQHGTIAPPGNGDDNIMKAGGLTRDGVSVFVLPTDSGRVTGGLLREHFPLPGRFHFRFKAPTIDQSFGGSVWIDVSHDDDPIHAGNGEITLKAMKLPDEAPSRSLEPVAAAASLLGHSSMPQRLATARSDMGGYSGGVLSAAAAGMRSPSPQANAAAATLADSLGDVAFQAAPTSAAVPSTPVAPAGGSIGQSVQPQPPAPAAAPIDLMEWGSGGSPSLQPTTPPAAASGPLPDRQTLVAQREAETQRRINETFRAHSSRNLDESNKRDEKLRASNKLCTEMDAWAKTSDGQNWKEIRSLLSTMHDVLWPGSSWTQVPLSDLLAEAAIKKAYRKAIIICHPDRHQEAASEQQYRAERIFQALNESFKVSEAK